ncbi:fungal-specific transcription factor domain-containing protein [Trametes polyzona]|nr:fungal-specific transcription factor domain-containing protein [Trametes polyzona]
MASNRDESIASVLDSAKRPKLQRACDLCRKKKIRCDGMDMPDSRCSKCISYGVECTYEAVNRRPPTKSYVEILESRLQKMEELVERLQPRTMPSTQEASGSTPGSNGSGPSSPEQVTQNTPAAPPAPPAFSAVSPADSEELDPSDDELEASKKLLHSFRKLAIKPPTNIRYHGKSSSMMLLQAAVDMKLEYTGVEPNDCIPDPAENAFPPRWSLPMAVEELPPHREFPPPDIMKLLMDSYFNNMNIYFPLLHRPTLEKQIEEGLHLKDEGFGSVVLLVCANGCRWIEDPRIATYGPPESPGWTLFERVEKARKSIFAPPRLYDLQNSVLMAEYMGNGSSPHHCWTAIGSGIRAALDLGAHRKKTYSALSKVEGELYRRAFWALVQFDRGTSFNLGRPCALQDEDIDADPVTECDDEYWDTGNPETDFKQPSGKPSTVTFFNCFSRLLQITAFALRTIYSINKSKLLLGFVGQEWEERTVAELDSLLNQWIDTIPDHLRWDPHRENLMFLNQSAILYARYYQMQIFVHRPFLPNSRRASRLTLPSLAICTNAARSCVHVSDVQFRRTGKPIAFNRMPLFTAGIVLLINMWGGKRAGLSNTSAADDVQKCMTMLKLMEKYLKSLSAGRLRDLLSSLYSAGDFQASDTEPRPNRKRPWDSDQPLEFSSSQSQSTGPGVEPTAPPKSTQADSQSKGHEGGPAEQIKSNVTSRLEVPSLDATPAASTPGSSVLAGWTGPSTPDTPPSFDLPTRTEDLGRVPFNYGFSAFFDPMLPSTSQTQAQGQRSSEHMQQSTGKAPVHNQPSAFSCPGAVNPHGRPPSQVTSDMPFVLGAGDTSDTTRSRPHPAFTTLATMFGTQYDVTPNSNELGGMQAQMSTTTSSLQDPLLQFAAQFQAQPDQEQRRQYLEQQQRQLQLQMQMQGQGQGQGLSTFGPAVPSQPQDPPPIPTLSLDDLALADNTLDVWSTAPTSLDWADWGAFVNNMSGGGVTDWPQDGPPY